jgi:hypothetical protein
MKVCSSLLPHCERSGSLVSPKKEFEPEGDAHSEIGAMNEIADAIGRLPASGRERVLDWATRYFRARPSPAASSSKSFGRETSDLALSTSVESMEIATVFASANPGTEAEKALVAAYWLLRHESQEEFDSFRLNHELTHLGHRVGNITRALSTLIATRPALLIQTRKEGKTKQARKKYKLTVEGIRRVERMLSGEHMADD